MASQGDSLIIVTVTIVLRAVALCVEWSEYSILYHTV